MSSLPADSPIRIVGEVTTASLKKLEVDLQRNLDCRPGKVTINIDSCGGNAPDSQILFKLFYPMRHRIKCQIFEASSSAALLALLGQERSIHHDGSFGIHLGAVITESNELAVLGCIAPESMERILSFRRFYLNILQRETRLPESAYTRLDASNKLVLDAEECLLYGVVKEIF